MEATEYLLSRHQFSLSSAPLISSHLIPRARYAPHDYTRNGVLVQAWYRQASSPDSSKAILDFTFSNVSFLSSMNFVTCSWMAAAGYDAAACILVDADGNGFKQN